MTVDSHESAFPRRVSPELCYVLRPLRKLRAQGRPGGRMHPGPSRNELRKERENHRYRRDHTGLPCAVVYGLFRALLGELCFLATVAVARPLEPNDRLTPSLSAPEPHDFTVRADAARLTAPTRPPQSAARFVATRNAPHVVAECGHHTSNPKFGKQEYFCARPLTGACAPHPTGKSDYAIRHRHPGERRTHNPREKFARRSFTERFRGLGPGLRRDDVAASTCSRDRLGRGLWNFVVACGK